jgi:hypothetical protein
MNEFEQMDVRSDLANGCLWLVRCTMRWWCVSDVASIIIIRKSALGQCCDGRHEELTYTVWGLLWKLYIESWAGGSTEWSLLVPFIEQLKNAAWTVVLYLSKRLCQDSVYGFPSS